MSTGKAYMVKEVPPRRRTAEMALTVWLKETERQWPSAELRKAYQKRQEVEAWLKTDQGIKYQNELFFSGH